MADGAAAHFRSPTIDGLVIQRKGDPLPRSGFETWSGGHPLPDRSSFQAAGRAIGYLRDIPRDDFLLFLVSGGGSSLLEVPATGLAFSEVRETTQVLAASGVPIGATNAIRRHLSRIKGGRLALNLRGVPWATLAISDVVGNVPSDIASGPTVPDPTSFRDAWRVVRRWDLESRLPPRIVDHLREGCRGLRPETPKPRDPAFRSSSFHLAGSSRQALAGAAAAARAGGYDVRVLSDELSGDTARAAHRQAAALRKLVCGPPRLLRRVCLLSAGETTVSLSMRPGKGGRCQEFSAIAAAYLANVRNVCALSIGTDGIDGDTDAAGAVVTGETFPRALRSGIDLRQAVARHDVYPYLNRLGALIRTGPTGTNVMDLHVLLASPE